MSELYAITALKNLIGLVIGVGRAKTTDDTGAVQIVQAQLSAKELPDLKRLSEYGFASRLPPGSDVIAVFRTGERSNGAIIASGNQTFRLKLENDGEVAIHDAWGRSIWFKKTGGIVVEGADQPILVHGTGTLTIDMPNVHLTGNLLVDGTIADSVRSVEADRAKYDSHVHGGVQSGSGNTGTPSVIE